MTQIISYMHIQTRPTGPFLLSSSKQNANLSLLKKKSSTSYRGKSSNCHIACSVDQDTASIAEPGSKIIPGHVYIKRSMFPPDFKFGTGTSAYQIEGAWNEGGKEPSIWDNFTHLAPERFHWRNGDVAADHYHRYKEDIKLMKEMGIDSYRFSIAWTRIFPDGTLKGGVNRDGVMFYNNLINELIENDITPLATLFHWDLPQALADKYNGFHSRNIVDDFKDYCQVCFREFGDRVKSWMTLNEPWTFCSFDGFSPESYNVTHNLILAHAAAARLYKTHFQCIQGGEIGITLNCTWFEPYSNSDADKAAAERALEFMLGWYMEPIAKGEYPASMRELVRDLPKFTEEESEMVKGSYDVLGLNYYSARYAKDAPKSTNSDALVEELESRNGVPIGYKDGTIYVVPNGIRKLLNYAKRKYNDPKIYITENGACQIDDSNTKLTKEEAISDKNRIDYIDLHLGQTLAAIEEDGVKVKGYYYWSLMDNFEWGDAYSILYGLIYIDYRSNDLARIPKASADWYAKFLRS